MTHAPTAIPQPAAHPPTEQPLLVEWVSEGDEGIDMLAWLSSRQKLKAPIGRVRAIGLTALHVVFFVVGALSVLAGLVVGKPLVLWLGVFVLLVSVWGIVGMVRVLNPRVFHAKVAAMARRSGSIESTEGRWVCRIGEGRVEFEWLDREHLFRFPSREITEVAIGDERVALLAGKHLRGFFPVGALPGGDPETTVWAALRHAAPGDA